MRWILRALLWMVLSRTATAAGGEPRWVESYKQLKSASAKVVLTKHAPYLLKDARSEIDFSYDGQAIVWSIVSPVRRSVRIAKDGGGDMPESMKHFAKMLFAILRWDQSYLSTSYDIEWTQDQARIKSKVGKSKRAVFDDIVMSFSAEGIIKQMVLTSGEERTTLQFSDWQAK
jgi:hypothetical protein